MREEKVSAVSNGAASVLFSRSRVKRRGHETLMESAGRVGPRASDMHQLHTTDRSLKRIRANEHEAPLSAAQPCGYSDNQSLQGEKFDLRSEVNSEPGSLAEEVWSSNKCIKADGLVFIIIIITVVTLKYCVVHSGGKKDHAEHLKQQGQVYYVL